MGDDARWLQRFHPSPDAPARLFCFPHAGGSPSVYFTLSALLSPHVEVLIAWYPQRPGQRDADGPDTIEGLADRIAPVVSAQADRPVALFGHSMGATLAFEIARRLEQDGAAPVVLFASGRRAPSVHRPGSVHLYSDDDLVAELAELSGTDVSLLADDEVRREFLPAIRRDYRAIETYLYRPGPPLACPIVALAGEDDPRTRLEDVRLWRGHTAGGFDLVVFPGGHFFLSEQWERVAATIRDRLPRG